MQRDEPINYLTAGFTSFFRRSIADQGNGPTSLRAASSESPDLNFDNMNVSGSLGDTINVGLVQIDGKTGRIQIVTEQGDVTAYFGNRREE